ncbi:MAG: competence protein ComEC [Tepidiforma sp.]|nr:MAG: competence protein ComEC [Tepidiforma sp.]
MLLIGLGFAWVVGLVPVGLWGAPWWMGAAWTAAGGAALVTSRRTAPWAVAVGVALAAYAGFRLDAALQRQPSAIAELIGHDVVISGVVLSEPGPGELTTAYDIRVELLETDDGRVVEDAGVVRAWLHQYARLLPGDRVRLEGELEAAPVFDTFDYRRYLASRGIDAVLWRPAFEFVSDRGGIRRALVELRLSLDRSLQRALPEPAASLAGGIAFGRDGGLSNDTKEDFNASGLRHLVAVSGANLVLVASMTLAVGVRTVGRNRAWPAAVFAVGGYVALAGFEPSVARAAVMTAMLFAGELVGRPQSGLPGLAAAVVVLTAVWPRLALDPGFQLSAAATAGLITLGPWLRFAFDSARRWWFASWLPGWSTDVAALSVAATAATTPITWAHFGSISLIGPAANVLVQPVVAVAFWTSLATAAVGTLSRSAGEATAAVAFFPLHFILDAASLAAGPSWATANVAPPGNDIALGALALMAAVAAAAYRNYPPAVVLPESAHRRASLGGALALAGAAAGLALAGAAQLGPSPEHLTVDVLDVGQGDAILLTTPHGTEVLVDTGPSALRLARELGAAMSPFDRRIELVIISHPQEDHIGGLPGLAERFRIGAVLTNGDRNDTLTADLAVQVSTGREVVGSAGDHFDIDGVTFQVLWPTADQTSDDLNARSLVVLVTYAGRTILLTGDADAAAQRALLGTLPPIDVLKVPHHGSRTNDRAFLQVATGGIALVTAGSGNPFGHPHASTLEALAGAHVFRTDLDGRIRVIVTADTVRVRTER